MTDSADQTAKPQTLGGVVVYLQVDGAAKASAFYQRAFAAAEVAAVPPDERSEERRGGKEC